MPSTSLEFASRAEHRAWLESQSALPEGFRVGTAGFAFTPAEARKPSRMRLALVVLDRPTDAFAARFTRSAFPGAPVVVGRRRLEEPRLGAVIVNNKVSNVAAPGGVEAAERVCSEVAAKLGLAPGEVLPASTGVIGWRLPLPEMLAAIPAAVSALQPGSALPAAEAIMTTDLYPKVRRAAAGESSVVGIAKGAGMIEPDLATMLVFLLTDADLPRAALQAALDEAVESSFQLISVDSDTSTSDTVALLSSRRRPAEARAFRAALVSVCRDLAEDLVRNGEGVHHVIRVRVSGAPDAEAARAVGKAVVNSPLVKCAVAGNDPNVGRLVAAVGKAAGQRGLRLDPERLRLSLAGELLLEGGAMRLDPAREERLVASLRAAELYRSMPSPDGAFRPPVDFPPHERSVEVEVELGLGAAGAEVLGADLTHEYVTENADYRS
jgi:glutamate N-acetyltransferase/amino-acid N-acetyltransferase